MTNQFLSRDISWLSFNGRVLEEAGHEQVPLLERVRFLSIYSSNLDEFYKVRMAPLLVINKLRHMDETVDPDLTEHVQDIIQQQLVKFGVILTQQLLPALRTNNIILLYQEAIPAAIEPALAAYFRSTVMAFLQIKYLDEKTSFFPRSNQLYLAVTARTMQEKNEIILVTVPSDKTARFFSVVQDNRQYIIFLEDIIKRYLPELLPALTVTGMWNIKITRDAELDLTDEFDGDLAEKIEKQLAKRDDGAATRFLYEPGFPAPQLYGLLSMLQLSGAALVAGGHYHNLKDFANLPVSNKAFSYPALPGIQPAFQQAKTVFATMEAADLVIHTPYDAYDTVLRFFNEAAVDPAVEEIYVALYRVADNSKIVHALITAAENGKQVTAFIELKARFDEENNIRWSKRMKAAGIRIISSIPGLKVHAKIALVKKKTGKRFQYYGLLATGNLNEMTARFYTDQILLTVHAGIVRELELLFIFLMKRRKPVNETEILFEHLLVAQFNLRGKFIELIDQEISNAKAGKPAAIIIRINNLEERVLIRKLYEAAAAGVDVRLIIRSICCLNPGAAETNGHPITVTRIVDRYLEHGRVFIFCNGGEEKIFLGSADWMNRNIYRRIEVCFPVYDPVVKKEIRQIIDLQLSDNLQAVKIDGAFLNLPVQNDKPPVQSQLAIYKFLSKN